MTHTLAKKNKKIQKLIHFSQISNTETIKNQGFPFHEHSTKSINNLPIIRLAFFNPIVDKPSDANLIVSSTPVVNKFNRINAFNNTTFTAFTRIHSDINAAVYSTVCLVVATLTTL
jgi:hypothetical protein